MNPIHRVPTHVWDLSPFCGFEQPRLTREYAQTLLTAALFGAFKQRLEAHADAEEWPAGIDVLEQRLNQVARDEVGHRIGGGADAREHDRAGAIDV